MHKWLKTEKLKSSPRTTGHGRHLTDCTWKLEHGNKTTCWVPASPVAAAAKRRLDFSKENISKAMKQRPIRRCHLTRHLSHTSHRDFGRMSWLICSTEHNMHCQVVQQPSKFFGRNFGQGPQLPRGNHQTWEWWFWQSPQSRDAGKEAGRLSYVQTLFWRKRLSHRLTRGRKGEEWGRVHSVHCTFRSDRSDGGSDGRTEEVLCALQLQRCATRGPPPDQTGRRGCFSAESKMHKR